MTLTIYKGTKSNYNVSSYGDGLYFTTDTHEILYEGYSYGETISCWSINDGVLTAIMNSGRQIQVEFESNSDSTSVNIDNTTINNIQSDISQLQSDLEELDKTLNTYINNSGSGSSNISLKSVMIEEV